MKTQTDLSKGQIFGRSTAAAAIVEAEVHLLQDFAASDPLTNVVLERLRAGDCSSIALMDLGLSIAGIGGAVAVLNLLGKMGETGGVSFTLSNEGIELAQARGDFSCCRYLDENCLVHIADRAFIRPTQSGTLLLTADRTSEVLIPQQVAGAFMLSGAGKRDCSVGEILSKMSTLLGDYPYEYFDKLVAFLFQSKFIRLSNSGDSRDEKIPEYWEFHDLLFHTRTTQGHGLRLRQGATYRFGDAVRPEPAFRPSKWPFYMDLPYASIDDLTSPFGQVVRKRRSMLGTIEGRNSIGVRELSKLLVLCQALKSDSPQSGRYEHSARYYPGAGACYEVELYPLIARCGEISPGLYHYDALAHSLHLVCHWDIAVASVASESSQSGGASPPADVVLLLSARFHRLAWKYEGIAYALCLKDIGVIFDHLYLGAAAIGIDVCALGSVQADRFSKVIGDHNLVEPLVGEFLISGMPA